MPPTIVDLTSSPEPDESPATAAYSALRTFQPRKQKGAWNDVEHPTPTDGHAAYAIPKDLSPMKVRETQKSNGITTSYHTPFGANIPSRPATNEAQRQYIWGNTNATKSYGERDSTALRATNSSPVRNAPPGPGFQPFRVHEGSLAALLQDSVKSISSHDNPLTLKGRSNITPLKSFGPSINGLPNVSLPKSLLAGDRLWSADASPGFAYDSSERVKVSSPSKRQSNIIVLSDDEDTPYSPRSSHLEKSPPKPSGDSASIRPFKRRRIDGSPNQLSPLHKAPVNGHSYPYLGSATPSSNAAVTHAENATFRSTTPQKGTHQSTTSTTNKQKTPLKAHVNVSSPPKVSVIQGEDLNVLPRPDSSRPHSSSSSEKSVLVTEDDKDRRMSTESSSDTGQTSNVSQPLQHDTLNFEGSLHLESAPKAPPVPSNAGFGKHGDVYTPAEDALLIKLKEVDGLSWKDILPYFPHRSSGSLQVRYSTTLKRRKATSDKSKSKRTAISARPVVSYDTEGRRRPQRRQNDVSVNPDFISWADIKKGRLIEPDEQATEAPSSLLRRPTEPHAARYASERPFARSLTRVLRQRELGVGGGRSSMVSTRSIPDELKEYAFKSIGPRKYFQGTSGDVTCLAWAPDGNTFAAGSIALTDERSMQYNRPCNLLLGDCERGILQELPEHHITRPQLDANTNTKNVNALHSMRATQDPRLFMTVASVQFSPDGQSLYSAGSDCRVRAYSVDSDQASCLYALEHSAALDLLSVSNLDAVATACHQSADGSIGVYRGQQRLLSLSPSRAEQLIDRPIYPSALRWGIAPRHSFLLLAGFSIDSIEEDRNIAGETCLWDVRAESRIKISGVTRNVFDVAWNPTTSTTSTVFAVASARGTEKIGRGMRSVVQAFAPGQNKAARVIEWECPAFDINDVVYCQHDDNIIAAGATDGKVYVWDQRFANRSNAPLHVLEHGATLNVLDHDREHEIADTGVRFISWGATSSRLYTGSSDGVVKVWNPYRSTENAHVKDVATFTSAVMSGAFSPDYRDLLVGEDQGRINWLSVGYDDKTVRAMRPFELESAPAPVWKEDPFSPARELIKTRKILLAPMGDLPKRQAIQGPEYDGPYLAPTSWDLQDAREKYERALDTQHEVHSKAAVSSANGGDDEDEQQALHRADMRVKEAQAYIELLESKIDDAAELLPKAEANQLAFRHRAINGTQMKFNDSCQLDCNYLPACADTEGEVPDSRRSEARIPGALRSIVPENTSNMTREDLIEAGLTQRCMSCLGAASKPKKGNPALCTRCSQRRNGTTASCERCSAPTRPSSKSSLCEKCDFSCFRCATHALVSSDGSLVTCEKCGITWEAGVLGYEVKSEAGFNSRIGNSSGRLTRLGYQALDDSDEVGLDEMEHYASLWQ